MLAPPPAIPWVSLAADPFPLHQTVWSISKNIFATSSTCCCIDVSFEASLPKRSFASCCNVTMCPGLKSKRKDEAASEARNHAPSPTISCRMRPTSLSSLCSHCWSILHGRVHLLETHGLVEKVIQGHGLQVPGCTPQDGTATLHFSYLRPTSHSMRLGHRHLGREGNVGQSRSQSTQIYRKAAGTPQSSHGDLTPEQAGV